MVKKQQESNRLKRLQRKRSRGRSRKRSRSGEESQLGPGTWHFWFLHIVTILGAVLGFALGDWWGAMALGVLIYLSPLLLVPRMQLSRKDMSRFYRSRSRG